MFRKLSASVVVTTMVFLGSPSPVRGGEISIIQPLSQTSPEPSGTPMTAEQVALVQQSDIALTANLATVQATIAAQPTPVPAVAPVVTVTPVPTVVTPTPTVTSPAPLVAVAAVAPAVIPPSSAISSDGSSVDVGGDILVEEATWNALEELYALELEDYYAGQISDGDYLDPVDGGVADEAGYVWVDEDGTVDEGAGGGFQFVSAVAAGGGAIRVNTRQPTTVDVQSGDLQRILSAYAYRFTHSQIYFNPRFNGRLARFRPHAILNAANAQAQATAWGRFQGAIPGIVSGLQEKVTGNVTVSIEGGEMWISYQSNGYTISMGFGARPGEFALRGGGIRVNPSVYYRLYVTRSNNVNDVVVNETYKGQAGFSATMDGLPARLREDTLQRLRNAVQPLQGIWNNFFTPPPPPSTPPVSPSPQMPPATPPPAPENQSVLPSDGQSLIPGSATVAEYAPASTTEAPAEISKEVMLIQQIMEIPVI